MSNDLEHADVLNEIAKKYLGIKTLGTRNSDALDFHNLAVWSLKEALEAAFEAGRRSNETA